MLSIQTNVNSMNAQENLRVTNQFQGRTIARLTSGFRINESGDDAAGLAIANKYRSDVAELMQGVRNANDGLSTLQIIDGGLNNISKMLDRMKTLAVQSSSATFTGNRDTVNTEFQSLLGEVDRQAANVGLGSGSTAAAQNNANIQVFIGGGASTSNSKVGVDLSGATNLVNSAGLGLTGTSVSGTGSSVALDSVNLSGAGPFLANGTQKFTFATAVGSMVVTVVGGAAGITGAQVISQLNAGLAGTGITLSANATTGFLQSNSSTSFIMTAAARTGAGTAAGTVVAAGSGLINTSKYNENLGAWVNPAAGTDSVITITPAGGTAKTLTMQAADTQITITDKLKISLAGSGIDVVTDGTRVVLQSSSSFTVVRDAGTASNGFANLAASASLTADAPSASSDPTANALSALTAIATAVTNLGNVQGKVGTGQNRLAYAIQLAQSQITSFSAAESRIRDADVAQEAANLTKAQVLQQASLAALAQANSAPQAVLSLLRG